MRHEGPSGCGWRLSTSDPTSGAFMLLQGPQTAPRSTAPATTLLPQRQQPVWAIALAAGRPGTTPVMDDPRRVFTIGHSNRSLDEFMALLEAHRIGVLADVRAFPGSRRLPHFGQDRLAPALEELGIAYHHVRELGGRRRKAMRMPTRVLATRGATHRSAPTRSMCRRRPTGTRSNGSRSSRVAMRGSRTCAPRRCHGDAIAGS